MAGAGDNEIPQGKELVKGLNEKHPQIVSRCEYLAADKGLDDTELNATLWDDHRIKPLIDIRNCWKDGEMTRQVERTRNVVYDYRGSNAQPGSGVRGEKRPQQAPNLLGDRSAKKPATLGIRSL